MTNSSTTVDMESPLSPPSSPANKDIVGLFESFKTTSTAHGVHHISHAYGTCAERVSRELEGNAIGRVRPSVSALSFEPTLCVCMGHDHKWLRFAGQGHRSVNAK